MGIYTYVATKEAYYKTLEKLNENQLDLIFYIHSNLKLENFTSTNSNDRIRGYEPLVVKLSELMESTYCKDRNEIIEDLKDLVDKKFIKKTTGKDAGRHIFFLDSLHIENDIVTVKCSPILIHVIATKQQMEECLRLDIEDPELIKFVLTNTMTVTKTETIQLANGNFEFVY